MIARYVCARCHGRDSTSGMCPKCPDEPLLDLADPDVFRALDEMDDRARFIHFGKLAGISAAVSLVVTVIVFLAADAFDVMDVVPSPLWIMIGVGVATVFGLGALWKAPKSTPELSEAELAELAALAGFGSEPPA